jgi:hypothetical protein
MRKKWMSPMATHLGLSTEYAVVETSISHMLLSVT